MPLKFAVVCRSNMNRSMEAHKALKEAKLKVDSFGTGRHCKLPGPSVHEPAVFPFGMPYKEMMSQLQSQDASLYSHNGVLEMLERNASIKACPQQWQEHTQRFDVVLTFEKDVFNAVLADVQQRSEDSDAAEPLHVINIETRDRQKEAEIGGQLALNLSQLLGDSEDIEDEIEPLLKEFEARSGHAILHTLMFC
eukprot:TRINITY_DN17941_c0_g2_i1.p1 TRINITY_DN17941_c0_g2~~TRINITY_DN17941_c0_g2_i1.p1  ORF type:complete len:194 (+),score=46.77 TRINITY_DN17941_c0_g2_i1:113-694(+)